MAKDPLPGKLAVILHADVAGSTQMVQQDEHLAHERIQTAFHRISETIKEYSGRVLELRGDALLAEFERPSDAVAATLAFQSIHSDFLANIDDDLKPEIRVGIAMGEVVVADNTITGAGVVMAQRVEQMADPGGLCITSAVRESLSGRLAVRFDSLGEHTLKGFDDTVRIFRVMQQPGESFPPPLPAGSIRSRRQLWIKAGAFTFGLAMIVAAVFYLVSTDQEPEKTVPDETVAPRLPDKPSIAVLPFDNMSGDPDQQYFADGIAEDLTTDLSKISGLFVAARSASFTYREESLDLREVSRELGVRYLLEGSLRRLGEQVRINAQLIDGTTGGHIWAERFDGAMSDIFELQDDVNKKIIEALEVSLTLTEQEQLDKKETTNSAAYDMLLRGLEQFHLSSPESMREARRLFKQAIELDPDYARAYANVAVTYAFEVTFALANDKEEAIRLGLEYVEKAMEIDANIPQIHFTRSALYLAQRKYDASIEAARRTVEIHPNYADGYGMLAFASLWAGNFEEALEAIHKSNNIDKQASYLDLALEARALFFMRRYNEAVPVIEASVERNPDVARTQLLLAAIYAQLDRSEDASWAVEEALAINPNISLEYERREANFNRSEDTEHYIESLRKAGVPDN